MTSARAACLACLAAALSVVHALGAWTTVAVGAAPGPTLARGLSDGRLLASADPELRRSGIDVARHIGGRVARIPIGWSTVVDNETFTRPDESTTALSDPAHPAYRWARIDASLRDLTAAGLTPLTYLMAAPPWAQSAPRYAYATPGTWAPRPADVAALASAVARRYDGTYPDPLRPGHPLPRVAHFQTWNEPNLARYLGPQWLARDGRPQLFSARWYRRMHAAAYAAIRARQPDALIGLAGLAPTGAQVDGAGRVGPLRFLRSLFCLGERRDQCGAPLPFDAISLHPLSVSDPDRPARDPDDIGLADLTPKLQTLLADARRAGRLRAGRAPQLWITELNWTASAARGIATDDQAAVIGRAMLRLHLAGASIVNWQFATDPPVERTAGEDRPAGLTTNAPNDPRRLPGVRKPFADGFAFPAAAIAVGDDQTFVWGLRPAGSPARRMAVQARRPDGWRRIAWLAVRSDGTARGVLAVRSGTVLRLRADDRVSLPVRSALRLRLAPPSALAQRAQSGAELLPAGADPRPTDPLGPGPISDLPPLVAGGTPPTLSGRPIPPVASPVRPSRRLTTHGTPGNDILIGSSGADRLIGGGGRDLLIGLGGDDRFDTSRGTATIVRHRRVEQR